MKVVHNRDLNNLNRTDSRTESVNQARAQFCELFCASFDGANVMTLLKDPATQRTALLVIVILIHILFSYAFSHVMDLIFENKVCNYIFRCGCTWNWAGGWNQCNVHNHSLAESDKCPFCNSKGFVAVLSWYYLWTIVLYWVVFGVQKRWWNPLRSKRESLYAEGEERFESGWPVEENMIGLIAADPDVVVAKEAAPMLQVAMDVVYEAFLPHSWLQFLFRLVVVSHSYFIFGVITAFFFKIGTGYPHFLWWSW
jgi:hypothetical protein